MWVPEVFPGENLELIYCIFRNSHKSDVFEMSNSNCGKNATLNVCVTSHALLRGMHPRYPAVDPPLVVNVGHPYLAPFLRYGDLLAENCEFSLPPLI